MDSPSHPKNREKLSALQGQIPGRFIFGEHSIVTGYGRAFSIPTGRTGGLFAIQV